MKALHRPDLFSWSRFDDARDIDFHTVVWASRYGVVVVDPLPISDHDRAHLERLGGVAWIVVTNSDHLRATAELAEHFGARTAGPAAERGAMSLDRWLAEGDKVVQGLKVLELHGSKTPGELALVLEGTTLITGDLVRSHQAGTLRMLPDAKLTDRAAAIASVRRLAALPDLEAVLVGDGFQVFRDGSARLRDLAASLE